MVVAPPATISNLIVRGGLDLLHLNAYSVSGVEPGEEYVPVFEMRDERLEFDSDLISHHLISDHIGFFFLDDS